MGNKDKTRDRDATAADRDHRDSQANRDHSGTRKQPGTPH